MLFFIESIKLLIFLLFYSTLVYYDRFDCFIPPYSDNNFVLSCRTIELRYFKTDELDFPNRCYNAHKIRECLDGPACKYTHGGDRMFDKRLQVQKKPRGRN